MQISPIYSMPHFARSVRVSFPFRVKCPRINENQPSIFARIVATLIPVTESRILIQNLKRRGCTFQILGLHRLFPHAGVRTASILMILRNFVNIASTHSQSRAASPPMIVSQRTTTALIAENPALYYFEKFFLPRKSVNLFMRFACARCLCLISSYLAFTLQYQSNCKCIQQ
jgi:hypothetical protein